MRELLFKNLTSDNKRRRVLEAQETIFDNDAFTKIRRGFICLLKPISETNNHHISEPPAVYIVKSADTNRKKEGLLLKIKGGLYAVDKGRLYFLSFCHFLKIEIQRDNIVW